MFLQQSATPSVLRSLHLCKIMAFILTVTKTEQKSVHIEILSNLELITLE